MLHCSCILLTTKLHHPQKVPYKNGKMEPISYNQKYAIVVFTTSVITMECHKFATYTSYNHYQKLCKVQKY